MSFVITDLTDYNQRATELLREGVLFNDDFAQYEIQSGIKYKEYLNYVDANPGFSQTVCGTPDNGTTTLTEKEIEVAQYAATEKYCYTDLDTKALGNIDLAPVLVEDLLAKVKTKVNHDLWIGSGTDYIEGWLVQLPAASDYIDASDISYVSATADNIDDIVTEMIANVSSEMFSRGVLTLYMDLATYNLYKQNRLAANYYRDADADFGPLEMWAFGYEGQIKIEAKVGIGSTKNLMLTWAKNLVIGVDEVSKVSEAEFIDDPITKYVYFRALFKMGNSIKHTSEVVYMKLA
jgi:hypothetical protein